MKTEEIQEGQVKITVPSGYKLDSKMPVFYNPVQILNRDISILLLNSIERKKKSPLRILDLLSASGIRGLRIKKEVKNVEVTINDYNKTAFELMKKNAKKNKLNVTIKNKSANVLLAALDSYDYIDVDPFGTPVYFLDSAIKRLSPHGIIAVTATDMSALCGAAPKACLRKYGSKPLRNEFMHETAIRILIKKCQEIAAQYDVALIPVFVHSSNHYIRAYLKKSGSAKKADEILKQHGYILYCSKCCFRKTTTNLLNEDKMCKCGGKLGVIGPVWLGELWNRELVKSMISNVTVNGKRTVNFTAETMIKLIYSESMVNAVGFYDVHILAKRNHWKALPKIDVLLKKYKGKRTHFRSTGIRTKEIKL